MGERTQFKIAKPPVAPVYLKLQTILSQSIAENNRCTRIAQSCPGLHQNSSYRAKCLGEFFYPSTDRCTRGSVSAIHNIDDGR